MTQLPKGDISTPPTGSRSSISDRDYANLLKAVADKIKQSCHRETLHSPGENMKLNLTVHPPEIVQPTLLPSLQTSEGDPGPTPSTDHVLGSELDVEPVPMPPLAQIPEPIAEYPHTLPPAEIPDQGAEHAYTFSVDQDNVKDAYVDLDLASCLPQFYRVLDLINEQSSAGLVDKVIISQDGLQRFINDISPGAYISLTKVDFKALDRHSVRPLGIYGDKDEIIRFLSSMKIIDDHTTQMLHSSKDDGSGPCLRSGIYIIRPQDVVDVVYAVYWPQEETWMDVAPESLRRNRTTFMRYLSKIADQLMCFMSSAQSEAFVWEDQTEDVDDYDDADSALEYASDDDNDDDRYHTFHITTTNEQQENVTSRPGFSICSPFLKPDNSHSDEKTCPSPQFLRGETCQGFLSAKVIPPKIKEKYSVETYTPMRLRDLLTKSTITFEEHLDDKAIQILIENGLGSGAYRVACTEWKLREDTLLRELKEMEEELRRQLVPISNEPTLRRQAMGFLIGKVLGERPDLDVNSLSGDLAIRSDELPSLEADFVTLAKEYSLEMQTHPALDSLMKKLRESPERYEDQKEHVTQNPDCHAEEQHPGTIHCEEVAINSKETDPSLMDPEVKNPCGRQSDQDLLAENLQDASESDKIPGAFQRGYTNLRDMLGTALVILTKLLRQKRKNTTNSELRSRLNSYAEKKRKQSTELLIEAINTAENVLSSSSFVVIKNVRDISGVFRSSYRKFEGTYELSSTRRFHTSSTFEYTVNKLDLKSDDRHNLQLDPRLVPTPFISQKDAVTFRLTPQCRILHAQLLQNDRLLLIVDDKSDSFSLYLDYLVNIGDAIRHGRSKRAFHKGRIGQELLVAFDESKRLLILCTPSRPVLYTFEFCQQYDVLRSWMEPVELSEWYNTGSETKIEHICSVPGTEEVLLVDSTRLARIWSFMIRQFLPASVLLPQNPTSVMASPDGACALLAFQTEGGRYLRAYHWASFGANTDGIFIAIPEPQGSISVTSFVNRHHVHLLMMNENQCRCNSLVLDITKKSSELLFERKGSQTSRPSRAAQLVNNSLVDCFMDVWTRFPVVAPVSRQSVTSLIARQSQSITFISDQTHSGFATYFANMVKKFEHQTKKPGRKQLKSIVIHAKAYHQALGWHHPDLPLSSYPTGEWLVNLLCLIPIHLAVARNNCFVPLKDGIISVDFEQSLLGADVRRIVDGLSFGWYESIFRSYMADKPVKVVSSMGEQSVGKSYSLNHLMDTSFAGSAMRTTEGVWMAITPTDNEILVALDFEGVHSIERSPQEDALLVLFNTAISNLVLFRNNFSLSRDIANLFQSFQASSKMLDPEANHTLFRSTLLIIVKDVGESDKTEIVREFELKFQRIVHDEKNDNFISKLHGGNLHIISWPFLESNKFYTSFNRVKRSLDSQPVTHISAGEFLHTVKMLMAKLKASDWSTMSQSLAVHRVQSILSFLPVALEYGAAEIQPAVEPLKCFDDDTVIDCPDTPYRLFLSTQPPDCEAREAAFDDLKISWLNYYSRCEMDEETWMKGLGDYLRGVADQRISHVKKWISTNLKRFGAPNANIDVLYRQVDNAIVDVLGNIELCRATCSECHLSCTLSRRHDPLEQPHDCGTDHRCPRSCEYNDDHPDELRKCGSASGHDGPHFCAANMHTCGIECLHKDKKGCQIDCISSRGHQGPHLCGARKHACGMPCKLHIKGLDGSPSYTCPETCERSSDEDHEQHLCDTRLCPIKCCLCNRLCANENHLHGLDEDPLHLCGQEHRCQQDCEEGICQIDTQPQEIKATFTGRHELFEYTRYTQVSKQLPCVKMISADRRDHDGSHVHTLDPSSFHFCKERCSGCEYICTLPRGHDRQKEHEEHDTRHGSMSQTRWVIDGSGDESIEVENRRFGSNDEGGPVMCHLVCRSLGRHAHVAYCLTDPQQQCFGPKQRHIAHPLAPNPDRPKDWISHSLYWTRSRFKDPYSQDDKTIFDKCDAMCPGKDHENQAGQPSYCTLPIFHPPHPATQLAGPGYVSNSGHLFSCINPALLQRAFHIILVIDRSSSMSLNPPSPLLSTPVTAGIINRHNNRLGAVYLSLHGFWSSRQAAMSRAGLAAGSPRRDAYSLIFFNHGASTCFVNDFNKTPDELLHTAVQTASGGGTNYKTALKHTEAVMKDNWSNERTPVVIFLTDGECDLDDAVMRTFCRSAVALGSPVSFHAISFGDETNTTILRRMAEIANEVESTVPGNPDPGANSHVKSSFAKALTSVQLSETFLEIADSLTKLRGALISSEHGPSATSVHAPRLLS